LNLDDLDRFARVDSLGMINEINGLPAQLYKAWQLGQALDLPPWKGIRQVVVAGMGGSATGADLLAAYVAPICSVPIYIHRDYDLPAWAIGGETLVIGSSHSGNTEETLSAFHTGLANGCRSIALTTGGKLAQAAAEANVPLWLFKHKGQPRSAVGFSFALLLSALVRLNLLDHPGNELEDALSAMQRQQISLLAQVPVTKNPAKRIAGQLVGRWVDVIGAGVLAPVARRWKNQLCEVGKAWASFDVLPEADHNSLEGIINPGDFISKTMVLFLRAGSIYPANRMRLDLTRKTMMLEGVNTDFIDAQGETRLAQQWTSLHHGDYVAYYLAMAYEVDPSPVMTIESFKREMQSAAAGSV